jgi:hypothetical protein
MLHTLTRGLACISVYILLLGSLEQLVHVWLLGKSHLYDNAMTD